jgi:hypothetical protein
MSMADIEHEHEHTHLDGPEAFSDRFRHSRLHSHPAGDTDDHDHVHALGRDALAWYADEDNT